MKVYFKETEKFYFLSVLIDIEEMSEEEIMKKSGDVAMYSKEHFTEEEAREEFETGGMK